MSEIQSMINFNDPLEVTQIFRIATPEGKTVEHAIKVYFGWEDVKSIESYPYPDNWESYRGPKYYIVLQGAPDPKLVLGDMNTIVALWSAFRNTFPLFTLPPPEGEDRDG